MSPHTITVPEFLAPRPQVKKMASMLAVPVQMVWPRLDPDDVDRGHPHGQSVAKNPAFLPFILAHEGT